MVIPAGNEPDSEAVGCYVRGVEEGDEKVHKDS